MEKIEKIDLHLIDGTTYQIDNKPGLTYIIGPNGTGKSYAFRKFAEENIGRALYILPSRDDMRRNLYNVGHGEENDFFREWVVYDQVCRYWGKALKQPGLLAMAFSFLERLGVPHRMSISVEEGEIKFQICDESVCYGSNQAMSGLHKLPVLGIAVYDPEHKLVIIDEPEQSLHPQAQHIFVQVLRDVARLQGKHFVLITHSPTMVDLRDAGDLTRVVFFRRPKKYLTERKIFQLSMDDAQRFSELLPGLTSYKREIFFADKVILVEGQHDRDVFMALIESGGFGLSLARTSVLPLGGVGFMAKYTAFFKEIGVKPFIICDRDVLYPSAGIRWFCGRMEGERLDWRGWISPSQVKEYLQGKEMKVPADRYDLQPAEFDNMEQIAARLRNLMKKALEKSEQLMDRLQGVASAANLLAELAKKKNLTDDYSEYRAFHLLMTVVLNHSDWYNTPAAEIFKRLREVYEQLEHQSDRLEILILRIGRLEDLYRHSGRLDASKTEKSRREAFDIRRLYQNNKEQVDVDYQEVIDPLIRKRYLLRMQNGIPHEAAAVLSGKIHELYDFLFSAGELAERVQKLRSTGKLEELSAGAEIVDFLPGADPPQLTMEIPLLKGYLSVDGRITLTAGKRPEVFDMLFKRSWQGGKS
ncbi:AAA ATPase [Desulfofarcimen acetoxidans DSM 771]|uniref:AAA ATPase n=1 Tax=Desulfofarcimen acetoxidans (strain ATCC 49208 / DSM 771 / KCTC 5769 / VKM B-1644 / 5575) TaxID=485916 RepID=C8VY19_DESAS|nr:TOPRIM nucleotidyl transferase/hydrolase domain-containing protein [Desulfofarcimen acetoxidans]ACV64648.1 AAA ATPase [Desulfofarcimen acetoxidans DSM 771]